MSSNQQKCVTSLSHSPSTFVIMAMLESIYQVDLRLLLWCRKSRYYPQFITMTRALSRTGDGFMQVLFPLSYWLLSPETGHQFFFLALLAFAIERPIYFVLKNCLKRRRPPEVVPDFTSIIRASDQFSFPSESTAVFGMVCHSPSH